ncbi:hypothetical protein DPEC_G00167390 [Dallia pectoralis]|uniref:Uncharacterized protein n=1 Tax=Dallia pectoralis TaxID=75939 RepID=A0ACC2GHT9_DALPE|nr:hypothetical protein DPEC_G00167390 [Dallia pectoralis]
MCNLTTQWAVPSNGPLNAGSVREINRGVSPSKNMINTPHGDAAEDEVGAAGSGSTGTQGGGGGEGGERSGAERAKSRTHRQPQGGRRGKGKPGHRRHQGPYLQEAPGALSTGGTRGPMYRRHQGPYLQEMLGITFVANKGRPHHSHSHFVLV